MKLTVICFLSIRQAVNQEVRPIAVVHQKFLRTVRKVRFYLVNQFCFATTGDDMYIGSASVCSIVWIPHVINYTKSGRNGKPWDVPTTRSFKKNQNNHFFLRICISVQNSNINKLMLSKAITPCRIRVCNSRLLKQFQANTSYLWSWETGIREVFSEPKPGSTTVAKAS